MNVSKLFATTLAIAVVSSPALAQNVDFYASVGAKHFLDRTSPNSTREQTFINDIPSGIGIEGSAGIELWGFRLGVVADHFSTDLNAPIFEPFDFSGPSAQAASDIIAERKLRETKVRAELVYGWENQSRWTPFIGGRVGVTDLDMIATSNSLFDDPAFVAAAAPFNITRTSNQRPGLQIADNALTYGGVAGIEFEITKQISLYASGEYYRTGAFMGTLANEWINPAAGMGPVFCITSPCFQPNGTVDIVEQAFSFKTDGFAVATGIRFEF